MAALYPMRPAALSDEEAVASVLEWYATRGWTNVSVREHAVVGGYHRFILEGTAPGKEPGGEPQQTVRRKRK